jgi:hypothetical protein
MLFSFTCRSFTLATTAILTMAVLSASSTSAAPSCTPVYTSVFDKLLHNNDFLLGTLIGESAPAPLVRGGLDGNKDALAGKPFDPQGPFASDGDNAVYTAGYLIGYAGTKTAPDSFVVGGITGAEHGSGMN